MTHLHSPTLIARSFRTLTRAATAFVLISCFSPGAPANAQTNSVTSSPLAPPPAAVVLGTQPPAASRPQGPLFRIGFLASSAPEHQRMLMTPFSLHVEDALQRPVDLIPFREARGLLFAMNQGTIDYVVAPGALIASAHMMCACVVPLASQPNSSGSLGLYSTLAVRRDATIGDPTGVRSDRLVIVGQESLVAHRLGLAELAHAGVTLAEQENLQFATSLEEAAALVDTQEADAILFWSRQETGQQLFDQRPVDTLSTSVRDGLRLVWRSRPLPETTHALRVTDNDDALTLALQTMLTTLHRSNGDAFFAIDSGSARPFSAVSMEAFQPYIDGLRYWSELRPSSPQ